MEANQNALYVGVMVTQTWCQHDDEDDDAASDTAHRKIDIEDVKETDLAVLTAGDEEPDKEPEAEKNYR